MSESDIITALYKIDSDGRWRLIIAATCHCPLAFIEDLKTSMERNGEKTHITTYKDVLEITKKEKR